jgi:2-iminoacetate synthase ThiH
MPEMNIQIPPNLSPSSYQSFLQVGINDWGGISPLTQDYVNPEFGWPQIEFVQKNTESAGFKLRARFPVYPEFMRFVETQLCDKMSKIMDTDGLVREECWR